jgi:hypothetical protein
VKQLRRKAKAAVFADFGQTWGLIQPHWQPDALLISHRIENERSSVV